MKRLYDINVHGAYFTAREAARLMIPQGSGSIVLVSSMSANVCRFFSCSIASYSSFQIVNIPQVSRWACQPRLYVKVCLVSDTIQCF